VLRLAPENLAAIRGLAEIHHRGGEEAPEHYATAGPDAEHIASEAVAEMRAASGALAEPEAVPPAPSGPSPAPGGVPDLSSAPALAGLEQFLLAIQRARSARG
jgi:hypothetical protein